MLYSKSIVVFAVTFMVAAEAFSNLISRFSSSPKILPSFKSLSNVVRGRILRCSTEQESEWSSVKIVENNQAGTGLRTIKIDVGEISSQYVTPGQYVQLKVNDGKPGYYSIASAPKSDGMLEFLIKDSEANKWLTELKATESVAISGILGSGFNIKQEFEGYKYDFPVQNILLVATGTGIAPIRAAIDSGMLEVDTTGPFGRSCTLYYGVENPGKIAYNENFEQWEEKGITVIPVMSSPDAESWSGRVGYVQAALEEDGVRVPRNTGALICGQKEMIADVKALLSKAGVYEGRQLVNF